MTTVHIGRTAGSQELNLVPGENLYVGSGAYKKRYGSLTSLEEDLLLLSSGVFAADLAIKRDPRARAIRRIEIEIEVVNLPLLRAVAPQFERALHFLSNDNWSIRFAPRSGTPEGSTDWPSAVGAALLFSGGLDSFTAATQLAQKKQKLLLISHVTHNRVTATAQKRLQDSVEKFAKTTIPRVEFRCFGRNRPDHSFPRDREREESQRTRSFLFVTLAALAARREGLSRVVTMAENGQFAIHLPLSTARIGPFSTHTAHPEFLHAAQSIFRTIFAKPDFSIVNPYEYKTKAEVVGLIPKALRREIPTSVSCWRGSRVRTRQHCGECVPCIARRVAIEAIGLSYNEYERDLFSLQTENLASDDVGKRNLVEFSEFVGHFSGRLSSSDIELLENYPELINPFVDLKKAVAMYRRFAKEASRVLRSYRGTKWLLR